MFATEEIPATGKSWILGEDAVWRRLLLFVYIILTTCYPSRGSWPIPSDRIVSDQQEGAATFLFHLDVMFSNVQAWPSMHLDNGCIFADASGWQRASFSGQKRSSMCLESIFHLSQRSACNDDRQHLESAGGGLCDDFFCPSHRSMWFRAGSWPPWWIPLM